MKKRALILVLAAAMMVVGGCCAKSVTNPDGTVTTTKSLANCFNMAAASAVVAAAKQVLCEPSQAVKDEAGKVVAFVQAGYDVASNDKAFDAYMTFQTLQTGACVFLDELNAAIAWFNGLGATTKAVKAATEAKPAIPNIQAWVAAKGK